MMPYRISCAECKNFGDVSTLDEVNEFEGAHPHPTDAEFYPGIAFPISDAKSGEFS